MAILVDLDKRGPVELEVETSVTTPSGIEISVLGELIVHMKGEDFTNLHFQNGSQAEIKAAKEILTTEAREIYDEEEYWAPEGRIMEFVHNTAIDYSL